VHGYATELLFIVKILLKWVVKCGRTTAATEGTTFLRDGLDCNGDLIQHSIALWSILRNHHGRDGMVVGFTSAYAISAYQH
jgi:hypothetical protein